MASRMSEHHQEELSRFLKFFRSRMKTHIENIEADFEDTCSDRLSGDDMYSQKDVKDAINSLCFAVKANVRSELQDTINMMALLLRQIFTEAEDSKLSLELDIGMVEDRSLLERVERLSVAEWVSDSRASISVLPPSGSDKDKEKVAAAAAAAAKAKAKEEEIARQLEREKKQHEEEIRATAVASKQQQDAQEAAHAKELKRLQRKLDAASDRAEELAGQLEEAQQHVAATKQFLALKKMVSTKNDQLQELRRRLRRYEPDAGDDDDAKNADDDE